jgi:alkylation response protein AidB-like acyl-CoA dehydrogenase
MMDGVEVGRVNVAARACGIAIRAFELAAHLRPAAQNVRQAARRTPGHRLQNRRDGHQGRGRSPDDGQRRPAQGLRRAQRRGGRHGQAARQRVLRRGHQEAFRIHGGYGYSKEYEIERLMREAPFLLIGEGTSEIQKMIISRGLINEYGSRA